LVKEKQKLTLSVDKEVVEKAKELGINISDITEKVLAGYTSVEKPEGSFYDAYSQLFASIQELLKEYDCRVKVAESWLYYGDHDEGRELQDETYLTESGSFFVSTHIEPEDFYLNDITKIPRDEFLPPAKILSNLVSELAKSQEERKEKMEEILMAKRIIDAMSESLIKKKTST
jgi:hypothetical protein